MRDEYWLDACDNATIVIEKVTPATVIIEPAMGYLQALLQSNPYLRQQGGFRGANMDGNRALTTRLAGRSNVTGRNEVVTIYTTILRNGNLFYLIGVTPQDSITGL